MGPALKLNAVDGLSSTAVWQVMCVLKVSFGLIVCFIVLGLISGAFTFLRS
jgi:hypothetical protein